MSDCEGCKARDEEIESLKGIIDDLLKQLQEETGDTPYIIGYND